VLTRLFVDVGDAEQTPVNELGIRNKYMIKKGKRTGTASLCHAFPGCFEPHLAHDATEIGEYAQVAIVAQSIDDCLLVAVKLIKQGRSRGVS